MVTRRAFRVLHATDGSQSARAAMATSASFPWPSHSGARAIVVRPGLFLPPNADLWARSEAVTHRAAVVATRTLRARWSEADAVVRDGDVVERILSEAKGWNSHALVIGWRGHGRFRRVLMGSVPRAGLRRADTPVLVVRRAARRVTNLVVSVDGSAPSNRAIRFLAHAVVPKGGSITLVTVLQGQPSPSHPLLPGLTAELRADILTQGAKNQAAADRRQKRCAEQLQKAGWRVRGQVRTGAPLYELLRSVDETRADALVVGATCQPSTRKGFFEWVAPWLSVFERAVPFREMVDQGAPAKVDVVVFGLGRYGSGIVRHLLLRHRSVIGVDFDPEALARWRAEGLPVVYGDASDPELFDHVPLEHTDWIVSTAPDPETSRTVLHHLRQRGFRGRTAVAWRSADDGDRPQVEGADLLLRPYADAAEQAVDALTSWAT